MAKLGRIKKQESAARQELHALQTQSEVQTRATSAGGASSTGKGDAERARKEEELDKQRIGELLMQLEKNNEEIFRNKVDIRDIKEQILTALEERRDEIDGEVTGAAD